MKTPRLLVATEFPPNASGGGPAVLRQMLKSWPVENLYWWSCAPDRDTRFGQQTSGHHVAEIPIRLYPNERLAHQKSWCLETFWKSWAARHLRRTLAALKPDAIWVIPHAWAVPPIAAVLPESGVGFHVTVQDYVDTRDRLIRFGDARGRRMAALAEGLYAAATTRDATSHPMIADLRARTGCDAAQMLHAGLESDDFSWLANKPARRPGALRIAYAGTIVAEEAFALFVAALTRLRPQLTTPVSLAFFGNDRYQRRPWFDPTWMHEHGNLPEPALTHALRECDWGFSPMDNGDPRGNQFSFPTKFISYLAAGLPVITLGTANSSVIKMARAYEVGPSSTATDATTLSVQLLPALTDPNPWQTYRAGIQRCAATEYDANRMRSRLYECFQKCAEATHRVRS